MSTQPSWRQVWEGKSKEDVPDFVLDRGVSRSAQEVEVLSERELVDFVSPKDSETLLDVGCGTGVNLVRFHSRVRKIIGLDYTLGSLERCQNRIQTHCIQNARICLASATAIPLPDCSVDRILCVSVLQYLSDIEVGQALREFVRVLAPGGTIILHVKNLSSIYWTTLRAAKKVKTLLGRPTQCYNLRPFGWYMKQLANLNCSIQDYNSFNLLVIDGMPASLLSILQKFEFKHLNNCAGWLPFVRRHGADLKIKATAGVSRIEPGSSAATPPLTA